MNIESRKIEDLIPYDRNPRDNASAVGHVLESLKAHGQVKPIVLSAKGKPFKEETIVAGHTTMEAMKLFGAKEINVVVKSFETEQAFVDYNIRDNKTSEFAKWDDTMLTELGAEMDINLSDLGFNIEEDFFDLDDDAGEDEEEEEKPPTKTGDDHAAIEFIMEHGEKIKFIKFLNEIKTANSLESITEALLFMKEKYYELINS